MKQMSKSIWQLLEGVANMMIYENMILIGMWYWDMIVRVVIYVSYICVDHPIYI